MPAAMVAVLEISRLVSFLAWSWPVAIGNKDPCAHTYIKVTADKMQPRFAFLYPSIYAYDAQIQLASLGMPGALAGDS